MTSTADDTHGENTVVLCGRLTAVPEERELPSGDVIVTFRVSVPRQSTPLAKRSRQTSDWVDCVASGARCRRTVARWEVGDRVEVQGALRRRFYRAGDGSGTRLEVEALQVRRVRAAALVEKGR